MQSLDFLKTDFTPLLSSHFANDALQIMNRYVLSHIPITEDKKLIGLISQEIIYEYKEHTLGDIMYEAEHFFTHSDVHWQEVLEIFARHETNIIPVLDTEGNYLGYYLLADFINLFTQSPFFTENGSFLIVEKDIDNFSFSEVSQIVESNQGKIWGIFISNTFKNRVQITLKINLTSLTSLLQTFRRYGYSIILEKEDDIYLKDLKEKSEYFSKYLAL